MAAAAYYFFFLRDGRHKITLPFAIGVLFLTGCAIIVGVSWEFFEFGFDYFISSRVAGVDTAQLGIEDTMADLFFDLLGAFLISAFFLRNRKEI